MNNGDQARGVEVVVLGGGPAGIAAALWCADLGLRCVLLESSARLGGQLHAIPHAITNLPGTPDAQGTAFVETLVGQLRRTDVSVSLGVAATLDAHTLSVSAGSRVLRPRAVVIATGVRRRTLDVPGERAFAGDSVLWNVGEDPSRWADRRVVIVGGGDDAMVHATLLAPIARSVTVVHRRAEPTARAALLRAVAHDARITLLGGTRVRAFEGDAGLRAVVVEGPGGERRLDADLAFVCAGPVPNAGGFGVALRPDGSIIVDRLQRTSRVDVFAVGDVCCSEAPTIATALGHGATAAKTISAMRDGALREAVRTVARDTLRLHGLLLPARVGAYAQERGVLQALRFDVSFALDTALSASTDQLEHTLDYASVAQVIASVLARRHYQLIEAVADAVASELLARFAIDGVELVVTKPGVPQAESEASVTVSRRTDSVRS